MLNKKKIMIHVLSLGALCIGFILCRYVFFDIHGMKQWPVILFGIGIIAIVISFILNGKISPVCTAFSNKVEYLVGIMFTNRGTAKGGTPANNLWIIWTAVFVCLILSGMIYDKFSGSSKRKIS